MESTSSFKGKKMKEYNTITDIRWKVLKEELRRAAETFGEKIRN